MGLKSHKQGVKAELRARFPTAFREFPNLVEARDASQATREQAIALHDGNVLLMSVPQSATTMDSYVNVVHSVVRTALATTRVVVIVFDEAENLTQAKAEEQRRRDAARAATEIVCSRDLHTTPMDDEYGMQHITRIPDVHSLVTNRLTRGRFFDEVAMRVMERIKGQIDRWVASGHEGGHLILDGIDSRGADRPVSQKRSPGIVASSDEAASLFTRDLPIGEGDLKLSEWGRVARRLAREGEGLLGKTKLTLCATIDTDSLAIESIEEAKRADEAVSPVNTLLCMRERAKKRGYLDDHDAFYLCVDVSLLHALLQRLMWGRGRSPSPSPVEQRAAMTLLVGGWALCGCDFTGVKGLRSDAVFDAIPDFISRNPGAIDCVQAAWSGRREDLTQLHDPLRRLVDLAVERLMAFPRINKRNLPDARSLSDVPLKQTSWVLSYWNAIEHRGDLREFGFFSPNSIPDPPSPPPPAPPAVPPVEGGLTEDEKKQLLEVGRWGEKGGLTAWEALVDKIKDTRGGIYPRDWFDVVIRGRLYGSLV